MQMNIQVGFLLFQCWVFSIALAGKASTWDYCGCSFNPWKAWSECSRQCGGGRQRRTRSVHHLIKSGCDSYEVCATSDTAYEYRTCNAFCHNGGSIESFGSFSYCKCPPRWKGSCCEEEIICGQPGEVAHGKIIGNNYFYGSTISYNCDANYNLTRGDNQQQCTSHGTWSGRKPLCAFAQTCQSNPCQNGGLCIDGLERYDCQCLSGWSGVNCELDVQPPIQSGCPGDIVMNISNPTVIVNWTSPTFSDPMSTQLTINKNYPTNYWIFHWGDYQVQYVATKIRNGLRSECIFNIKIRPYPCESLKLKENSAKLCTNWKNDFGQYCLVFCDKSHTLSIENEFDQWYVCGASGHWNPAPALPKCDRRYDTSVVTPKRQYHYDRCGDTTGFEDLKDIFIRRLNASEFSYFCHKFGNECSTQNVLVECY